VPGPLESRTEPARQLDGVIRNGIDIGQPPPDPEQRGKRGDQEDQGECGVPPEV